LILIFLGGVFLLQNMSVLPSTIWTNLWKLWPAVLVLFGLELLFGRRASWLVGVLGLCVVIFALGAVSSNFGDGVAAQPPINRSLDTALDGATQAVVNVRFGAGQLTLGPLADAPTTQLASMTYEGPTELVAEPTYTVSQNTGRLDYQTSGHGPSTFPFNRGDTPKLDIRLSPIVPLTTLTVQTGATDARLDLSSMRLQNLDLSLGAASAWLRVPERGTTSVHITSGAANLTIEVPQSVAAQVRHTGGLTTFNINQDRFPAVGDGVYRSVDWSDSPNRVDITLETGLTTIQVN
jgi:Domain of unknown function (DUF5668)